MTRNFQNSTGALASLPATTNSPNLKFEREDWTSFRTVEGLMQKAGVPKELLSRLVLKEITDNALDTGAKVEVGELSKRRGYFVEDTGNGIDGTPQQIAHLFSIHRPMVSTKYIRLPQRGALGNGLRVVASAVLVSNGSLAVIARNQRIELRPERDGSTTVVSVKTVRHPVGTRIEISFGSALPCDEDTLSWALIACRLAGWGKSYTEKSSPWWYDLPNFRELLSSAGDTPVRDLLAQLDGEASADATPCNSATEKQAATLLKAARGKCLPVLPEHLGGVGAKAFSKAYACVRGTTIFGTDKPLAEIPYVVEAWVSEQNVMDLVACVNRTPVASDIYASRDKRDVDIFGCGLHHTVAQAPKEKKFSIWLNITTPFMPITSDGKEPDFTSFSSNIAAAVSKAVRKARLPKPESDNDTLLPKRRRGRQSPADDAIYRHKVKTFCKLIRQIKSTLDFAVGSRGYCYLLEEHGLTKGEFDAAEKLITACRKSGDLPLDICAEDASRETIGVEEIDKCDVPAKVDSLIDHLTNHAHERYLPISLWDDLDVYVEVATEKLDLRNLFEPVCNEFHVPITNIKGWSDVNARAAMMRRFKMHEAQRRKCVLLLCGDHDPGGLHITDKMRKNLNDVAGAVGWSPANLVLIRFGLNADFIDQHDLTWIDNLETSSGGHLDDEDHADHYKEYVQNYIDEHGVRKCEANALVVEPIIGRQLCRDAILQHIPVAAVQRYERKLKRLRQQLRTALQERIES
jgi:hypothetical protein